MKIVRWVCIVCLLVVFAIPLCLFALLNSPYTTQTWHALAPHLNLNWQVESVTYDAPYHFTLKGVSSKQESLPYTEPLPFTEQIDIWFNPDIRRDGRWVLDSVLIDGANWTSGWQTLTQFSQDFKPSHFELNQIALQNIDIVEPDYHLRGVNLQINQPQWSDAFIPYGEIQFSADQLYWQQFALNNLLIDINYQAKDSTVWGFSFDWEAAKVSGQAEQFEQGWSLINVTLDKLNLDTQDIERLQQLDTQSLPFEIYHINSLDLLQAGIRYQDWHWQNLNLSIEDWESHWFAWQGKGSLSLQADSLLYKDQPLVEPYLQLTRKSDGINIDELTVGWQQGQIQLSGLVKPRHWALSYLNINGLKWTLEQQDDFTSLAQHLDSVKQIDIASLDINQSQLIQLSTAPFWQISGLNAEGKSLSFKQDRQFPLTSWGMWDGNLDVHLTQGSYQKLITSHAALNMKSEQGKWQLTRLFAPLEEGYVEAYANLDLSKVSRPWVLNASIDGLPLNSIHPYLPEPMLLEGYAEVGVEAKGLAGDSSMLGYSLTGEMNGALRDVTLIQKKADDQVEEQNIEANDLNITADRGQIKLSKFEFTGNDYLASFKADFDLAETREFHIETEIKTPCYQAKGNLFEISDFGESCGVIKAEPQPKTEAGTEAEEKPITPEASTPTDVVPETTTEPKNGSEEITNPSVKEDA